jgi:tetratricopeptide (TPR) repeat protein
MVSVSVKYLAFMFVVIFTSLVSCGSSQDKPALTPELQKKLEQGKNYLNSGKFFEAEKEFSEILIKDSTIKDAIYNRGIVYLSTSRPRQAIMDFSKLLLIDSANADAYNNRGLAYSSMSMNDPAILDYNKAIELDGKFTEAFINRGMAYIETRKFDLAAKDLNKAETIEPQNPSIPYQKGIMNYRMAKYDESITEFSKSISMGFKHPLMFQLLGNAYFRRNDFKQAIDHYTESLKMDPDNTEVINNLAVACDKLGDKAKAQQYRKLLTDINKKNQPLELVPFDKLKYKIYSAPNKEYTIELPEGWYMVSNTNNSTVDMLISATPVQSVDDMTLYGVRLSLIKEMSKQMGTSNVDEMLDAFNQSLMANVSSYHNYKMEMRKTFNRGEYVGYYTLSTYQVTSDMEPGNAFELLLAKPDAVFFGYFQSPSAQFDYFKQIYERAMKSVVIK